MRIPPVFDLEAFGQRWRVTFLPGVGDVRTSLEPARDVWRARIGDVFVEIEHVAGEERKTLERRLVMAINGVAHRHIP